jgi:2-polyprenyl-6-methoxyphenol hydroxylase-like FAD-dependent oxidoreductase
VLLGDAAHALSPQLGQGANLALMDGAALADCASLDAFEAAGEPRRASMASARGRSTWSSRTTSSWRPGRGIT